ncbi:endospore germination permease [Paenibacillus sp. YYML68]|uniref:GerAB/ArcD/ProY family transporter n=1 Tax=Paenibacillus sp. YYML68 TaxID=2909250 RepID=UPI0024908BF3|nr:endospore germination permease [Paenibacillus sp. YYML68]
MRNKISSKQLAALLLAFLTGSAIMNVPGPLIGFAKNGAWLSLLLSSLCGLLLLLLILFMIRRNPGKTWIEVCRYRAGTVTASLLAIPFVIYVFIMLTWIVLDIGAFFTKTMMPETPLFVFNGLILLTAALTARAGLEVIGRMFVLLVFLMMFFSFAVLILTIPHYHPSYLLPVLEDGWKPVLHGAYFTFGFPYAEITIFSMLLPLADSGRSMKLAPYVLTVFAINVFSLLASTVCTIMSFGPLAGELQYSVFEIARLISIQEFVDRVESVIGISLVIGSYMKVTIALYVLNLACSQLTGVRDGRLLVMPITISSFILSLTMFSNEAQFAEKVTTVWPFVNLIGGVIPVVFVAGLSLMKVGASEKASRRST